MRERVDGPDVCPLGHDGENEGKEVLKCESGFGMAHREETFDHITWYRNSESARPRTRRRRRRRTPSVTLFSLNSLIDHVLCFVASSTLASLMQQGAVDRCDRDKPKVPWEDNASM